MGWGSEPVCRLGAHPLLHALSLLTLPYSREKSPLRPQFPCAEVWPSTAVAQASSLPTSGSWGISPNPLPTGTRLSSQLTIILLS